MDECPTCHRPMPYEAAFTSPDLSIVMWRSCTVVTVKGKEHLLFKVAARLVGELVACKGEAPWWHLANLVWPDHGLSKDAIRHRWDVTLARTREVMASLGLPGILHSDGTAVLKLNAVGEYT